MKDEIITELKKLFYSHSKDVSWSKKELITILSIITVSLGTLLLILKLLNLDIIYLAIFFDVGFFLITLSIFLYFLRNKKYSLFPSGISFKWFFFSFLLAILVVIVGGGLSELLSSFLNIESSSMSQELLSDDLWLNILQFKIVASMLVPITEELIFRGLIFKFIRQHKGFIFSAIMSSLIFSVLHFNLEMLPFTLILGLITAYAFEKTNSLFYPIFIHMLVNNLASSMLFYSSIA